MKRSDKLAIEAERAWEIFQKHFRLAQRAWRTWERKVKACDRAGAKEQERELQDFDLAQVKKDALATQPWPKRRR